MVLEIDCARQPQRFPIERLGASRISIQLVQQLAQVEQAIDLGRRGGADPHPDLGRLTEQRLGGMHLALAVQYVRPAR